MDGILNINKPSGPTSFDVVARIRRITRQKRVGHTGTLDPAASGVLVVCLGNATRVIEYLMDWHKEYRATALIGVATDSEDQTGNVLQEVDCSHITRDDVEAVLPRFTGTIQQIPPMVSAVHHEGKRLYELARLGQVVERQPRTVEIYALRLLDFEPGDKPVFTIDVECSKGTYIRTLCADIGAALNCPAHMTSLVRTRVGRFSLDDAISLEDVQSRMDDGTIADLLLTPDDALMDMAFVQVTAEDADKVSHGAILSADTIALPHPPLDVPIRIMGSDKELLGIGHFDSRDGQVVLRPDKVFAAQAT